MLQDGRCKTLDAGADGYARGEACITHLLERFELNDKETAPVHGHALLLYGTAVNQDGRSSSLTVSPTLFSSNHPEALADLSCREQKS